MGQSTISMAIFNSFLYVDHWPEGKNDAVNLELAQALSLGMSSTEFVMENQYFQ